MVEVAVWDALATPAGDLLFNKDKVRRRGEQRRTIVVGDGQGGNWSGGEEPNKTNIWSSVCPTALFDVGQISKQTSGSRHHATIIRRVKTRV